MSDSTQNTEQWDQYWESGRESCCCDQDGSANAEIIRDLWTDFFASLDDGERVIDLCTGNGAVVNIALECANQSGIKITACGVDSASITPVGTDRSAQLEDAVFVRASVTALPFEDRCFDAVTSQFGIEYLPPDKLVKESMRVLNAGGRGLFIAHAQCGVTVAHARAELADIHELQNEIRIFPVALEALKLVCQVERATLPVPSALVAAARRAHEAFNERLARVGDNWQQRAASAVFGNCGDILQHTYRNRHAFPIHDLTAKVTETEASVEMHKSRLEALVMSALDREECEDLVKNWRHHGASAGDFSTVTGPDGADQLAWAISLQKSAA